MNGIRVKFKQLVVSPVYGNCGPGDVIACDPSFACHVVEELGCAEYLEKAAAPKEVATEAAVEQPAAPARKKK